MADKDTFDYPLSFSAVLAAVTSNDSGKLFVNIKHIVL
jgi:hypothetical protein